MEALSDNLPSILGADNPFMPFSKINPLMSLWSSFAHIIKTSAIGEFDIQVFVPFNIYLFPYFFALVSIPAGSEPALGSVKPKHPINSPEANFLIYLSF